MKVESALSTVYTEDGIAHNDSICAVDNRCPHMGFPLEQGSVDGGILTCHWHHARFDLESGGTFDQFADDVRAFPVDIRGDEVWIDVAPHHDPRQHQRERLEVGLERNLSLVMGKAVLVLLEDDGDPVEPFRLGLTFGTKYRRDGWRQGLRGVFDAAMRVYLDRFLNIPAARIPQPNGKAEDGATLLAELPALLDRQQQVNQAAEIVARNLHADRSPEKLLAMMGKLLLREDRDFHTIQTVEGAFKQYERWRGTGAGNHALIAAARYLAAHSPTVRAQEQTYTIAYRLHRGERLFEG